MAKGQVRQLVQSERSFQDQVLELATRVYHWRTYHTWLSLHSRQGFPDLVLVRAGRLVFAELKREGREPTELQAEWLADLGATPAEVYLWRPSDWQEIVRVLT